MPVQTFETQPYYDVSEEAVYDDRVVELAGEPKPTTIPQDRRIYARHSVGLNEIVTVDFLGSDGEGYSGFITLADVKTPDERKLTIIRSWQFSHDTGMPPDKNSWSAEFDDPNIARDFWENHWQPRFDGIDFVDSAKEYLRANPDIPKGSVRVQELGLLYPWHSQRLGEHVLLEKFSTAASELVRLPSCAHQPDDTFKVGQVYKVKEGKPYKSRARYVPKTCLAAFVIEGRTEARFEVPDTTFIQWSDGNLNGYRRPIEDTGPKPLTEADLN